MQGNSNTNYQLLVQSTAQNPHGSICITINQATSGPGSSSNTPLMMNGSSGQVATGLECRSVADINKEYFNIARKQFKCPYVECSAKYNWHVTSVFKELMKIIEKRVDHDTQRSTNLSSHGRKTCRMQ
uniref:SP-RING-type domain-containing protein n=1 Tax=Romanomermis culicivorax TaxID=13658 RepID=A0A915IBT6_ROMCU